MSEKYNKYDKIHFDPSTIETIDRSVYNFVKDLDLFADTNRGRIKVPVVWGTPERAYLAKKSKEARDKQGTLIFPVISVKRNGLTKPAPGSGIFIGNVPQKSDFKGGSLPVMRIINQEKSSNFASATSSRLNAGDPNRPIDNKKIVYKTVSAPMPVNVEATYQISIRTEFQQQMNELILPFITVPGTVRNVPLYYDQHRYEGFIEGGIQTQNNLESYNNEERKFETKINLKVIGYLIGEGKNGEKPFFAVRENAVEFKLPKERVIIDPQELEKYNL
tara:strand:+ start:5043 stop:5870 length:828 start_codon:yes stop_codon:yes gene_type:complete